MAYLSSLSPSCGLSLYFHNMSFINCSCWPWSTCSTTVAQWTNIGLSFLRTFYIVVLTVCSMFEGSNRFTLLPQNQKGSALPPQTAPPTAPFKTANAIFTGEIQDLKQQGNSKLFRICPSFWGTKTCLLYPPQFCKYAYYSQGCLQYDYIPGNTALSLFGRLMDKAEIQYVFQKIAAVFAPGYVFVIGS